MKRLRWGVLALLVLSVCINYVDRGNLSVAGRDVSAELHIAPDRLGLLFSAFFWTYASFQILAGWAIDRYNVVRVFAAGYLIWSLATVCTGFVTTFGALFALRLLLGMSESVAYPSYSRLVAANFPEERRGFANSLIDAGSRMGPAIGVMAGGLILSSLGWRALFFIIGGISLLWLAPWLAIAPKLETATERGSAFQPGFAEILGKREAWGTFFGLFAGNYAWYFLLTWLPPYLLMERHWSREMMALHGSLPYWTLAASSLVGGRLSDALIRRGASPTRVRRSFLAGGLAFSSLLVPACLSRSDTVSMALLIASCIPLGMWSSNVWAVTQTLAGTHAAGRWTGLQNAFGNLAGVTVPWLTGVLVKQTGSFHLAFFSVAAVVCAGALAVVLLVPKVAPVPWIASARTEPGRPSGP